MKNKTAFIFLLLANLILLAHAVIPHHHHADKPLEIAVECSHHEEHSHHENIPVCDDDHNQGDTSPCIIASAMLLPNNQEMAITSIEQVAAIDVLPVDLLVYNTLVISINPDKPPEFTERNPIYARLLVSSQGLRAPPLC